MTRTSSCVAAAIVVGAMVVALAPGAGAGAARARVPQIKVSAASPMTIQGTGFRRRERVSVTVRAPRGLTLVHRLRATRAGSFTTAFPGFQTGRCGAAFTVTATGALGSRATLARKLVPLPACYPASRPAPDPV